MNNVIDFSCMGFDENTDEFLNYCMKYRNNLQFIMDMNIMETKGASVRLDFASSGYIENINENKNYRRK